MAISSPINIQNVSGSIRSLKLGLNRAKQSAGSIKTAILNRTIFKRQAIAGRKVLQNRRTENIGRRDQEDILEATGISGVFKRAGSVATESAKGFLGRILDFITTMLVGWLLYNLPTILAMVRDLIKRVQTLFSLLQGFISNVGKVFNNLGNILNAVLYDVTHLDFLDSQKKVQNAMKDLESTFGDFHNQFDEGFKLFTTPLGEGKGEEPVPATGTNFTSPTGAGSMVGGSNEQKTMSFLISSGLTPEQASGVAGNIQQESHFDPNADNGGHHGIAQWDKKERWPRVSAYIKSIGKDPNTLEGQLYGLVWESKNYGTWQRVSKSGGVSQASDLWLKEFEKPGNYSEETPRRSKMGQDLYKKYKNYNPQTVPSAQLAQASNISQGSAVKNSKGILSEYITGDRNDSHYSIDHGGPGYYDNYHDHLAFKDKETTLKAYNFFKSKGFKVTEFGVSSGHSDGSLHYFGRAFDIPGYQWGGKKGTPAGSLEFSGSAKVRSSLAEFLNANGGEGINAQVSSTNSGRNVPQITQERRGQQIVYIDDRQPTPPPIRSGGGGGQSSPQSVPEDGLNSLIKMQMLLDLAYT